MTKIQKLTLILTGIYLVWELYVYFWSKNQDGPIIRADLIFIYPILAVLILISLFQWIRGTRSSRP